jgi:hypothetical protein
MRQLEQFRICQWHQKVKTFRISIVNVLHNCVKVMSKQ